MFEFVKGCEKGNASKKEGCHFQNSSHRARPAGPAPAWPEIFFNLLGPNYYLYETKSIYLFQTENKIICTFF